MAILGAALLAVSAVAAMVWLRSSPETATPGKPAAVAGAKATYVGAQVCGRCHAKETDTWRGSQHALALQPANERTVLGDFADRRFTYAGVTSTFFTRNGQFWVRTDGPDGKLSDYPVKYTFGVAPLQQYLLELPGGRLQALSVAWDTRGKALGGQRWFHLYPRERITHADELHWTGREQNWNYMCADCHSTGVRKQFDPKTDTYTTEWSDINVACEACHGPGSRHVAWADGGQPGGDPRKGLTVALDERTGVTWVIDRKTGNPERNRPRLNATEIEVCAQCHSRRGQIAESHQAGQSLLDSYLPALLTAPTYYADGQQRDEVYTWGSFLQSKMHERGVTCSDCHDPHSQRLRAPGNAVCAQCHLDSKYDVRAHHFHEPGTPGAACVSCHMPATTYMVIDPRHDHSLRVPRPDRTASLRVPNACNACHPDKSARWTADAIRRWYGHDPRGSQPFAEAFGQAEQGRPGAAAALVAVAGDPRQSPIVRASALARLVEQPTPAAVNVASGASRDPEALVRRAALGVVDALPSRERVAIAAPLLDDPARAVRMEAAHVLAGVPAGELPADRQAAWERAAQEYIASQRLNADRPENRTNLGSFFARLGRWDEAEAEFRAALALEPRFVPGYVNAADAYRMQGRDDDAVRVLREGLAVVPQSAPLHHALGLARVRQKQLPEALQSLERAAALMPDNARYAYVYAVALHSSGRAPEAIRALGRAARRWPGDRDILFGLATMRRDGGQPTAARQAAEALVAAYPDDPEARQLLQSLSRP